MNPRVSARGHGSVRGCAWPRIGNRQRAGQGAKCRHTFAHHPRPPTYACACAACMQPAQRRRMAYSTVHARTLGIASEGALGEGGEGHCHMPLSLYLAT